MTRTAATQPGGAGATITTQVLVRHRAVLRGCGHNPKEVDTIAYRSWLARALRDRKTGGRLGYQALCVVCGAPTLSRPDGTHVHTHGDESCWTGGTATAYPRHQWERRHAELRAGEAAGR